MLRLYDTATGRTEPIVPAGSPVLRMRIHPPGDEPRREPTGEPGHQPGRGSRSARLDELRPFLLADLIRRMAGRQRIRVITFHDSEPPTDDTLALSIQPQEHPPASTPGAAVRIDLHIGMAEAEQPAGDGPVGRWVRTGRVLFHPAPAAPRAAEVTGRAEPFAGLPRLSDIAKAGVDPLAVRLAFLRHGYRQPVELSWERLRAAGEALTRWRRRVAEWAESPSRPIDEGRAMPIQTALDDDLDTSRALRLLADLGDDESVPPGSRFETFLHFDRVLGLDLPAEIGKV